MKNRCIQIIKKKILAYFQTKICMHVQLRKIKELFNKTVLVLRMRSAFLDQPWKKKNGFLDQIVYVHVGLCIHNS